MTPADKTKSPRLAALFGGEVMTVKKVDGTEITVKVALVPIRHLDAFINLYANPAELVDFVTHVDGKPVPEGWADQLSDLAVEQICDVAKALNFQRAVTFSEGQIAAGKALAMPIMAKLLGLRDFVQTQVASSIAAVKPS